MMISRRSFLKYSAAAGGCRPEPGVPPGRPGRDCRPGKRRTVAGWKYFSPPPRTDTFGWTLNTCVPLGLQGQGTRLPGVLLGFTVTNLTGEPVWIYHVHSNAFGQYEDGSQTIGGVL